MTKHYQEDELLTPEVIELIEALHGVRVEKIVWHAVIQGLECDAILYAWTRKKKRFKTIGIELKEHDFTKVLHQALARRSFFHYTYIVTASLYLEKPALKTLEKAQDKGIGIILTVNNQPTLIRIAEHNPRPQHTPIEAYENTK